MTTVEALKELFTALGGSAEDVENIVTNPEMVHAIAEIAGNIGGLPEVTTTDAGDALIVNNEGKWDKAAIPSQLPSVSAADNGNVLSVVNGAWGKADASGGVAVVNATYYSGQSLITYELTNTELINLINMKQGNVIIVAKDVGSDEHYVYRSQQYTNSSALLLSIVRPTNTSTAYRCFTITNGTVKQATFTLKTINDPA